MEVEINPDIVKVTPYRVIFKYWVKKPADPTTYRFYIPVTFIPLKRNRGRPRKLREYKKVGRPRKHELKEVRVIKKVGRPRKRPTAEQQVVLDEIKQQQDIELKKKKKIAYQYFRRTGRRYREKPFAERIVLIKVLLNVKLSWGLTNNELSEITNIDCSILNQLSETSAFSPNKDEERIILLLARAYRCLPSYLGEDVSFHQTWFKSHNIVFNKSPLELIKTLEGMGRLVSYLESNADK